MFYLMLSFIISAHFKLSVLGSARPKLALFSVVHYRSMLLWSTYSVSQR